MVTLTVDEQAQNVINAVIKIRDKCDDIMRLAEAVSFAIDGIQLTQQQKQQILTLYQTKKAELFILVEQLP